MFIAESFGVGIATVTRDARQLKELKKRTIYKNTKLIF
jgi:Trp operon repressor